MLNNKGFFTLITLLVVAIIVGLLSFHFFTQKGAVDESLAEKGVRVRNHQEVLEESQEKIEDMEDMILEREDKLFDSLGEYQGLVNSQ